MSRTHFVGLDLGQQGDYTALSVLERSGEGYDVRHLERFELGTRYEAVARRASAILASPKLRGRPLLVVDATGVGRPVVEMLEAEGLHPVSVTITGGDSVTRGDTPREYRVPKRDLATTLQVLLQGGRLRIAKGLPMADVLRAEMQSFKIKVNLQTGHDSYEHWRDGDHDDLVLSVAMAAWAAEQRVMAHTVKADYTSIV